MMLNERIVERFLSATSAEKLQMGKTIENGTVRMHRFRESIKAWDLTHAGKRGKRVETVSIRPSYSYSRDAREREEFLDRLAMRLEVYNTFNEFVGSVKDLLVDFPDSIEMDFGAERSVDVTPAGFHEIKIQTDRLIVEVGYKDFRVVNQEDKFNEPTCIPAVKGGLKGIPIFYRWVSDNQDSIKHMGYHDVLAVMNQIGVPHHTYCAMD